ncbi:hypothetical protein Tco_0936170 [Tanacetum coccineum]
MMTYLKHVEGKKHSDLKTKFFEEIHVLYEKVKRSDEIFIAIGSVEDERLIKDLNKKAAGIKKADSIKEESKEEEVTSEDDETNSEKENDELRLCLTIALDEDKEIDYEILDKNYPITEWKSYNGTIGDTFRWYLTLMTEAGLVIHMLVEKKYPLRKKVLLKMLELKLESKEDNTMALELIRFVKKLIAELEPENSDRDEDDL